MCVCDFSSRYSIDKRSDTTKAFIIDPNNGTITVAKALDRETTDWHNVTVAAKETGKEHLVHMTNLWLTQLRNVSGIFTEVHWWQIFNRKIFFYTVFLNVRSVILFLEKEVKHQFPFFSDTVLIQEEQTFISLKYYFDRAFTKHLWYMHPVDSRKCLSSLLQSRTIYPPLWWCSSKCWT